MKNKTILATIFLSLSLVSPALAGFSYTIGGITITDKTTAAELIMYFFNIGIMIGSFLAVVMVIMAGFNYLTSGGNPGKLEESKKRIQNSIFGIVILIGSYLILNTVNPDLMIIKINRLDCSDGIVFKTKDGLTKCLSDSAATLPSYITGINKWNFTKDAVYKVYFYSEENYKGTITEVPFNSTSFPSGAKSMIIIKDYDGLYLYDDTNLKPKDIPYPFFVNASVDNLGKHNIQNISLFRTTSSVDVRNKDTKKKYGAVVFSDVNFSGECSDLRDDAVNMGTTSNGYTRPIGNKNLGSIVVYKTDSTVTSDVGSVSFCNNVNCDESRPNAKICTFSVAGDKIMNGAIYSGSENGCSKKGWTDEERVFALRISGNVGVVLRSTNNQCAKWDVNSPELAKGNRLGQLQGTAVFPSGEGGAYPREFIIYPVDKE
jgi:hypothetical protein